MRIWTVSMPNPAWAHILKALFIGLTILKVKESPILMDVTAAISELNRQIMEQNNEMLGVQHDDR